MGEDMITHLGLEYTRGALEVLAEEAEPPLDAYVAEFEGALGWPKKRRQAQQVVRRAAEDEQPVHLVQSAQLHLTQRPGLLQPPEALFDQPAAAQTDGINGLACILRSRLLLRPLSFFVTWRSYIQLPHGAHKILRAVGLDRLQAAVSLVRGPGHGRWGVEPCDVFKEPGPTAELRGAQRFFTEVNRQAKRFTLLMTR
jgi:hypothetical protein